MAKVAALPLAQARMCLDTTMVSVKASKEDHGKVDVTTSDGETGVFDKVVLTTPLGWLKKNKNAIDPLDPRLSDAIESISYGRMEKVWMITIVGQRQTCLLICLGTY